MKIIYTLDTCVQPHLNFGSHFWLGRRPSLASMQPSGWLGQRHSQPFGWQPAIYLAVSQPVIWLLFSQPFYCHSASYLADRQPYIWLSASQPFGYNSVSHLAVTQPAIWWTASHSYDYQPASNFAVFQPAIWLSLSQLFGCQTASHLAISQLAIWLLFNQPFSCHSASYLADRLPDILLSGISPPAIWLWVSWKTSLHTEKRTNLGKCTLYVYYALWKLLTTKLKLPKCGP